ncbi:DUF4255 domain-containing protein (plasmid) [Brasilonema octagenarum UFV-E1]|uniref:DUF4255 domain-containing protein n=2 Tax=Brasilonema TaxID=383614 RepID=A0A856MMV9_9CYAN|nr:MULTISPECIES: DUF4255 domain-containing protein [Brasilonema]NMF62509.1 DUF4255 domain-containing protein [Brasilonema octagenarum UFV-OR1]QDL12763.1 DUF4255 domain-containing protein [Brasilonema sennae CENA114]QDL19159.1 DUF4255 domain-containing protein [Brasilonema octagenarum UFV-E1]
MSHTLSLVAVTAVLKDLLENGLVNDSITASIGDVIVTALPPDRISVGTDERAQINLFLYQVTQNRNVDWIAQEIPGKRPPTVKEIRSANPPLALDLHYLLTAYGAKDFQSELLLGYVMQLLHEMPVLTSDIIETALKNASAVNTSSVLSQALSSVSISDLAENIRQIKISPEFFSMEETSKLWSALQTNYRPSAAYRVSMVAIKSRNSNRYSHTIPLSRPIVEEVAARAGSMPEIVAGSILLIRGKQLRGDLTRIRLSVVESLLEPQDVIETQISLSLPPNLYAGIHGVQVVHLKLGATGMQYCEIESNIVPFVLHPTIAASKAHVQEDGNKLYSGEISIQCHPKVGKAQRVTLLLYEASSYGAESYSFCAAPRDEDTKLLAVPVNNVRAGTYLVQIQVDGAESPLQTNQAGQYDSPQIII